MVVSNAEQPGQQPPAAGLIRAWLAPQFEKRLLDDLFGGGGIAQQAERERVNAAAVAIVDQLECARLSASNAVNQPRIGILSGVNGRARGCLWPTPSKREAEFHGQPSIDPARNHRSWRQLLCHSPGATSLSLEGTDERGV